MACCTHVAIYSLSATSGSRYESCTKISWLLCVTLRGLGDVQDAVALKFFTDAAGFANEQRAYSMPAITQALDAPTFMNNADRAAVMPSGLPFPPFTVAEKGQSLEVWLRSFSADAITTMQVCPTHGPAL